MIRAVDCFQVIESWEGETDWQGSEGREEPEADQTPECESREQYGQPASGTEPWPRRAGRPGLQERGRGNQETSHAVPMSIGLEQKRQCKDRIETP